MKPAREPQINLFKKSNPYKAKVISNVLLTPETGTGKRPKKEGEALVHRIVLAIDHSAYPYVIGQSGGVIPPGEDPEKKSKRFSRCWIYRKTLFHCFSKLFFRNERGQYRIHY